MLSEQQEILLIDDDPDVLDAYSLLLQQEGYEIYRCDDPRKVPDLLPPDWPGIVICDVCMPALSGLQLMEILLEKDRQLPVLLISGHGTIPTAVEAVKKGAFDYLEKPVQPPLLLSRIREALQYRSTLIARRSWQTALLNQNLIGNSTWINKLRTTLQKLAEIDLPVFFSGETGCGRTLAARYLHNISIRANEPFIQLELVEGATATLEKVIEEVKGGTLVIRNIEYLSLHDQQQIIHHLFTQHGPFRLIAISQFSPAKLAAQRQLLPELYYHFTMTHHECLPLYKRPGDIKILFNHYLQQACQRLNKPTPKLTTAFIRNLSAQSWPGNIHEVINAAELYAVGLIPFGNTPTPPLSATTDHPPLEKKIEHYERTIIIEAMNIHQGKINDVASYLQIPRKKLYLRMKKYGIDKEDYRS